MKNKFFKIWSIILLVSIGAAFSGCNKEKAEDKKTEKSDSVPVALGEAVEMIFENRVELSGSAEAKETAIVSARIGGIIDKIFVDEGDEVIAGKTEIFQTDKLSLEKDYQSAVKLVAVAESSAVASSAVVDRIQVDLDKARLDTQRFERLFEKNAVSKDALESQQSRLKQLEASLAEAVAGKKLAQARVAQARNDVDIAAKNLSDSLVVSPISGSVSKRMVEPGEMAETGTAIVSLVDLSCVEVSAYLPESYYGKVYEGKTRVRLHCGGVDLGEYALSYKSPVVEPELRTFEIKVKLDPAPEMVVPGRLIKLSVITQSEKSVGVPAGSVVTRGGKSVVFVSESGQAKLKAIETAMQCDGYIQILGDEIFAGDKIVTVGQRFCKDGQPIRRIQEGN